MGLPNILSEINTIKSTYLPLSGGMITGSINVNNVGIISGFTNDAYKLVQLTSDTNSGFYAISGGSPRQAGSFICRASLDGSTIYDLTGNPDGTLTWNRNQVITSAGGTIKGTLCYGGHDLYCDKDNDIIGIYGGTNYTVGCGSVIIHGGLLNEDYGEGLLSTVRLQSHSYDKSQKCSVAVSYQSGFTCNGKQVLRLEEVYNSGQTFYRVYSDGWIEQGGVQETRNNTLTFPKAFSNTNYKCYGTEFQGDDNARAIKFNTNYRTTTSIRFIGSANPIGVSWYACGY